MGLDDPARDEEAEAGALAAAFPGDVGLAEASKMRS